MIKVTCIVGPSAVTPQQEAHAESPHEGTISGLGIWQPLTHQVWGTFPGYTHGSDFQHSRHSWPCVSNTQQISLCSPFHSLGSFSPSLLWKLLDPISPETPYESLPDVFQMLGLGTRSEIFQIVISTMGMCCFCNPIWKRRTPCWGSHRLWGGLGNGQNWRTR